MTKEVRVEQKPFTAIQRIQRPPGKGAARQPEASLAWVTATSLVKRRQRILKPSGKPRNRVIAGVFAVFDAGTAPRPPIEARRQRSGRGPVAGQGHVKERQETWEIQQPPA